jgi:crossover junction endodeoxyribonuclease RusA
MAGGEITLELPWPPSELSPNARLHWRALSRHKKAYKDLCAWKLLGQPKPKVNLDGPIPVAITFYPPDCRRRDRDNMQSSLKYGLDMIAQRMGVDDNRFEPLYRFSFAESPRGRVTVEIGG